MPLRRKAPAIEIEAHGSDSKVDSIPFRYKCRHSISGPERIR
jgi:hypothetical protein